MGILPGLVKRIAFKLFFEEVLEFTSVIWNYTPSERKEPKRAKIHFLMENDKMF